VSGGRGGERGGKRQIVLGKGQISGQNYIEIQKNIKISF